MLPTSNSMSSGIEQLVSPLRTSSDHWLSFLASALGIGVSLSATIAAADPLVLNVIAASAGTSYDGHPSVNIVLGDKARQLFGEFTKKNVGCTVETRFEGKVLMRTVLRTSIEGGRFQIGGSLSEEDAKSLATRLSSGSSTVEVEALPGRACPGH
jgi:preprotein translocase subunit SecD